MSDYLRHRKELQAAPRSWLITGVAGFIGSNLLETLLRLDQRVVGLDNFATGSRANLELVRGAVSTSQWRNFRLIEGDITKPADCRAACAGTELVLHQAALGSVPGSLADPLACHQTNATGFVNMLIATRDAGCARFIFASSSAVYGDLPELPKREETAGNPLSPYAASKAVNELYAAAFQTAYGLAWMGLRYFNVFGPRQDPRGAYAAVIPRWITALLRREPVLIHGDGGTSRDFCPVDNVVEANLLAATVRDPGALNQIYNVALGRRTTLNELFATLQAEVRRRHPELPEVKPVQAGFRPGDIRHSLADISKAERLLGYAPAQTLENGLKLAMDWYERAGSQSSASI